MPPSSPRPLALGLVASAALVAGCAGETTSPSLLAAHRFRGPEGAVILDTRIGGSESAPFLLDTGASPCVIDTATAGPLGIRTDNSTERRGGAGTFTSGITDAPVNLNVADTAVACTETLVTDLSGVTGILGVRLAGIIGGDFFRGQVVEIDFDSSTVSVHDRSRYRPPAAGTKLPLRIEKNRPYVELRLSVAGGPQGVAQEVMVDTGSFDHVGHPMLKEGSGALRPVSGTGLGSGFTVGVGTWSKVELGPHVFENVPGNVPSVPIIGNGILAGFNLVFDYDGGWLMLRPRKNLQTTDEKR